MIFNSVTFLVFLFVVVALYWFLPNYPRKVLLFCSSLIFYGFWRYEYTFIMLISAINDYWVSILIDRNRSNKIRNRLLLLSLLVNLGILFYFKYLIFFANNAVSLLNLFHLDIQPFEYSIILPLGISFYTFQTISYTVDVYRGFLKPTKDFWLYGSFVTFFPQLVAGPILRASEVINQLTTRPKFDLNQFNKGILRISMGLFLKVVLADNISPIVDDIYLVPVDGLSVVDVLTKAFMFGFQIYFDFAAYSHIAIGAALLMGISFPENFNYPYAAASFKDFWKRWHISLSSWIRDYLYLPIMGVKVMDKSIGGLTVKRASDSRSTSALFLTWGIMGLWHGANWTFVFWGLYHATMIYLERRLKPVREKVKIFTFPIVGWSITFVLAMLSWLPFRQEKLQDVFIMYGNLLFLKGGLSRSFNENTYLIAFLLMLLTIFSYLFYSRVLERIEKSKLLYPVIVFLALAIMTVLNITFLRPISQFIYFQF